MAFKSEKQRRWMHLHHPEVASDWEKKYKDGGFVEDAKEASKEGDVVDAKLTKLEAILNYKHMEALSDLVGAPIEKIFQKIGLPGFEDGQNPMEARGGGVASKKDHLMGYTNGGVEMGRKQFSQSEDIKAGEKKRDLLVEQILSGEEVREGGFGSGQVPNTRDYQLYGSPSEDYYDKPNPRYMEDPLGEPKTLGYQNLNIHDILARVGDISGKKSKYEERYGSQKKDLLTQEYNKGGVAKKKKKKKKRGY